MCLHMGLAGSTAKSIDTIVLSDTAAYYRNQRPAVG